MGYHGLHSHYGGQQCTAFSNRTGFAYRLSHSCASRSAASCRVPISGLLFVIIFLWWQVVAFHLPRGCGCQDSGRHVYAESFYPALRFMVPGGPAASTSQLGTVSPRKGSHLGPYIVRGSNPYAMFAIIQAPKR